MRVNVISLTLISHAKALPPQKLLLNNNDILSVDRIKLLGVIISSDLHRRENTAEIVNKVNKRYYQLCKLKQFGISQEERLKTWKMMIRPVTEYAAPLWNPGLLECDKRLLENLQKKALGIIFGTTYIDHKRYYKIKGQPVSYELALKACDLPSLAERRENLTVKFAQDTYNNPMHKKFFSKVYQIPDQILDRRLKYKNHSVQQTDTPSQQFQPFLE